MAHISERDLQLPDAMISKMLKLVNENKKIISLGAGEPDFPAPLAVVRQTKKIADKCSHYSPASGRIELKEAIIKKLKNENKIKAGLDNITVTTGSQEALLLAASCTMDVSEQIIVPKPSYMGYVPTFMLLNIFPIWMELSDENGFEINPDALKKLINKKTKAIVLNTPANPTGNVISKKILEEIADIAVQNDLYVFSDEAYEKIIYDNAKHVSIGSLNGMENNTVSFFTFSKSYAMCGYRLGYCVAPENLAKEMKTAHIYSTISAPTISQMLGITALKSCEPYVRKMVKEYDRRRRMIVKRLNDMGLPTIMPKGAFYSFSKIDGNSTKFAENLIEEQQVAVIPGSDFGTDNYIRCSFATDYTKIEKAMDRIEKFIRK